ncbi:MAG: M1 family aminopeptidase [Planctomycetota bacterium]
MNNEEGTKLPFSQEVLPFEEKEKMKVNYIDVAAKNPIPAREKTTVQIEYEGQLGGYVDAGYRYVKDHISEEFTIIRLECFAYPIIGYPSEKTLYESIMKYFKKGFDYLIEVTVPEGLVVANGGKLVGKTNENGMVTYVYKNIKPAWRMDVCVAKYGILEDKESGLKVHCLINDEISAKKVLDAMKRSHALFTKWFGELKNRGSLTVIELSDSYGSQVDVTCILLEREAFGDKLHQVYHEVSHLWNPAPLEDLPSRFETEGLASFIEFLVAEKFENKEGILKKNLDEKRRDFRQQCQWNPKLKTVPIVDYGKEDLTQASYSKGMIAFYVLYRLVGEETFINIVRTFYQKYGENGAALEDFVNVAKKLSKTDLNKFFREWVYGVKSSEYLLSNMSIEDVVAKYRPLKELNEKY